MRNIFDYKDNLHVMDHIPAILKWGSLNGPKPDVSILMPVYNHPHFFKIALETALNQDYNGVYEIIVLDNNQDDDVNAINEFEQYVIEKNDPKILYYKNEHNIDGINSYNRLPQLARADYFTFLHDDDELTSDCLSELMRTRQEMGLTNELIVPALCMIDKESNVIFTPNRVNNGTFWKKKYRMNMFDWFMKSQTNGCGTLHHRESFIQLGGYCRDFIPSADYAFYCIYAFKYGGVFVCKPLMRYRVAENDSISVYEDCEKMGYKVRNDLIPVIKLPNKILSKINTYKYKCNLERDDKVFGSTSNRKVKSIYKFALGAAYVGRCVSHII